MTTIQGRLHGKRCAACGGAVRWDNAASGQLPGHTFHQDFLERGDGKWGTTESGHLAQVIDGAPLHTWEPGRDGGPDLKQVFLDGPDHFNGVYAYTVEARYPDGRVDTEFIPWPPEHVRVDALGEVVPDPSVGLPPVMIAAMWPTDPDDEPGPLPDPTGGEV